MSSAALSHSWFHCLSRRVWVSPLLSSPSDERLSKHRPTGLLIFIIHTSCRRLFSSIGWDFVTSWKKGDGVYLWKQGRHCWGLYLCLVPPRPWPLASDDDIIGHIVLIGSVSASQKTLSALWHRCSGRSTFFPPAKRCKTGHVEKGLCILNSSLNFYFHYRWNS